MPNHTEQLGYVTIAQNSDTDYLKMAYAQALSIKHTQNNNKYAVIVDAETHKQIQPKHLEVFDYVIELPIDLAKDESWKLANEWQVHKLTPFKETIKVEADILFTRSIDHWINAFRLRDVVLSLGCLDHQGNTATSRAYRKLFDKLDVPDVYTGLMYFRYTQTSTDFFRLAQKLFQHLPEPTTDLVYAMAAKILGPENCTLPGCDFIKFVHMKPAINSWPEQDWTKSVLVEIDVPDIRINNQTQFNPVHYQVNTFNLDEVILQYERRRSILAGH
jgi:hypothetical protein